MADEETVNEAGGAHYGKGLQPWDLQESMESSGDAYVDARRCDAIKYSHRMKGKGAMRLCKLLDDLKKARHCLDAAIKRIEKILTQGNQYAAVDKVKVELVVGHPSDSDGK